MKKQYYTLVSATICILLVIAGFFYFKQPQKEEAEETFGYHATEKNLLSPIDFTAMDASSSKKSTKTATATPQAKETAKPAEEQLSDGIYTYLQGPKSWGNRVPWSGEWGDSFYNGAKFGAFGCGLCCIANLYSSLTPYQCTPLDAYRYAKNQTGYPGGGAIDWGYMKESLEHMGLSSKLQNKPGSYKAFQEMISSGKAAITLVSSDDSKCYWTDTPGHYVTIFLYDQKKDKVFLADSGVPEHNRQWVSLEKIYKSLKTASTWQVLLITEYHTEKDSWKHKALSGIWVKPK